MFERPQLFPGPYPILFPRNASPSQFVALLIDGDNIQLSEKQLIRVQEEASLLGELTIRRVYGNWVSTTKSAWKGLVLRYALQPCYHIHGAPGKNATDIALVVDAMDLYYSGITRFCLVTGDSDYTPLIQRLRSTGCQVLGIGNPAKKASLVESCDRFLTLAQLGPELSLETRAEQTAIGTEKNTPAVSAKMTTAKKAKDDSVEQASDG